MSQMTALEDDLNAPCVLSKDELSLLISGYIHCGRMPKEIIHWIACYLWPKLFDHFNAFRFKENPDREQAQRDQESRAFRYPKCDALKFLVIPVNEIKRSCLLPFDEINVNEDGVKKGKYSSFRSKYCPSFLKQENCAIHEVVLDDNGESIYHLLDSFVVNKFVELFDEIKENKHWHNESLLLPAGRGPFRAGFRCAGSQKPEDPDFWDKWSQEDEEIWDKPDKPWYGKWHSWKEIKINGNDLKKNIFPFLMNKIFGDYYMENNNTETNCMENNCMDIDQTSWKEEKANFCELLLKLFEKNERKNKIRAFYCRHIGFDFYKENPVLLDKIFCCIDDEKLVVVYWMQHRRYG